MGHGSIANTTTRKNSRRAAKQGAALAASLLISLVAFQNCSEVEFARIENQSETTDLGGPVIPPPSDVIDQIVRTCAEARSQNLIQSRINTLVFEDTAVESGRQRVCEFGVGDNLSVQNGVLRARYTQNLSLSADQVLPEGAVLCDMTLISNEQDHYFDDHFYFNLNNVILVSSHYATFQDNTELRSKLMIGNNTEVPFYNYDWLSVRNERFDNQTEQRYCLWQDRVSTQPSTSGYACTWPETETTGRISLRMPPEYLVALTLDRLQRRQSLEFSYRVTGDNDEAIDCRHNRVTVQAKSYYYLPAPTL